MNRPDLKEILALVQKLSWLTMIVNDHTEYHTEDFPDRRCCQVQRRDGLYPANATLVCEVIRYRLVQVWQNLKQTFRVCGHGNYLSISSSFILFFVFLKTIKQSCFEDIDVFFPAACKKLMCARAGGGGGGGGSRSTLSRNPEQGSVIWCQLWREGCSKLCENLSEWSNFTTNIFENFP